MNRIKRMTVCVLCLFLLLAGCNNNTSDMLSDKRGESTMKGEELEFYPEHPSNAKTHRIETTAMPILEQEAPFDVKTLCDEFAADANSFYATYVDKRFEVTGIAKKGWPRHSQ